MEHIGCFLYLGYVESCTWWVPKDYMHCRNVEKSMCLLHEPIK